MGRAVVSLDQPFLEPYFWEKFKMSKIKKYHYFISWQGVTTDNNLCFGCGDIILPESITEFSQVEAISKVILSRKREEEEFNNLRNVVVLNYILLKNE
jgi:hypothetical protein